MLFHSIFVQLAPFQSHSRLGQTPKVNFSEPLWQYCKQAECASRHKL